MSKRPHHSPPPEPATAAAAAVRVAPPAGDSLAAFSMGATFEQCKQLLDHVMKYNASAKAKDVWDSVPTAVQQRRQFIEVSEDMLHAPHVLDYIFGTPRLVWWQCDTSLCGKGPTAHHSNWGIAGDESFFATDPQTQQMFSKQRKKLRENFRTHFEEVNYCRWWALGRRICTSTVLTLCICVCVCVYADTARCKAPERCHGERH